MASPPSGHAWPLTPEGHPGSGPNNRAPWRPSFQARHQIRNNHWVRGHMLNDNIRGPGEPKNLVPITGTLNTNMLGIVERFVKRAVAQGFPRIFNAMAREQIQAVQSGTAAVALEDATRLPG
jgi:hypothetical protein